MRNLAAKRPGDIRAELEAALRVAYQAHSPIIARSPGADLSARFDNQALAAARCLEEDFGACIALAQVPVSHRRVARSTNARRGIRITDLLRLQLERLVHADHIDLK